MSDIETLARERLKALDPKRPIREADMCGAARDVRYGPIADIGTITAVQAVTRPHAAKSP